MILPPLPISSILEFNLVWIFLFYLPINLAKCFLQSGSMHNVQKLPKIEATASKNGNDTKPRPLEVCLYKLVTYSRKPSIVPKHHLSSTSTIRLLHSKQDLVPSAPSLMLPSKTFAILLSYTSKKQLWLILMYSFLKKKLIVSHQPLLPIPILMTKSLNLLSTLHPPSQ